METYRIFGRKQLLSLALCAVLTAATLFTVTGGAASLSASTQKKLLPIYAVGREEDDKVVSLSFDAAWGAGRVRNTAHRAALRCPKSSREARAYE